jgi:hypothetical protein
VIPATNVCFPLRPLQFLQFAPVFGRRRFRHGKARVRLEVAHLLPDQSGCPSVIRLPSHARSICHLLISSTLSRSRLPECSLGAATALLVRCLPFRYSLTEQLIRSFDNWDRLSQNEPPDGNRFLRSFRSGPALDR